MINQNLSSPFLLNNFYNITADHSFTTSSFSQDDQSPDDSDTLDTGSSNNQWQTVRAIVVGMVLGFVMLAAVFGNLLVVLSVLKYRRLRILANSFIVSLAFADLLVALLVMPFSASQELWGRWLFSLLACNMFNANDVLFSTASLLHLCCISMDRYIAITDPLSYETRMTKTKVALMLVGVWGASILLSHAPIHMGWHLVKQPPSSQTSLETTSTNLQTFPFALFENLTDISTELTTSMNHILENVQNVTSCFNFTDNGFHSNESSSFIEYLNASIVRNLFENASNSLQESTLSITDLLSSSSANSDVECLFEVNKIYGLISSMISFWSPAAIMVFTYVKIFREAKRQQRRINSLRKASMSAAVNGYCGHDGINDHHSPRNAGINRGESSESGWTTLSTLNSMEDTATAGLISPRTLCPPTVGQNVTITPRRALHIHHRKHFQRENKAAKTLGIIMGTFLCCWLPFFSWYVISTMCGDGSCGGKSFEAHPTAVSVLFWIGYFNSVLNPVIYAFCNRDFRRSFKALLACRSSDRRPGTDFYSISASTSNSADAFRNKRNGCLVNSQAGTSRSGGTKAKLQGSSSQRKALSETELHTQSQFGCSPGKANDNKVVTAGGLGASRKFDSCSSFHKSPSTENHNRVKY